MIELWGVETARRVFGEALAALENVRCMVRDGAIQCDALEAGHLKIAHRPGRAAGLAREADLLQRELGYPAEYLTAAEVRARHIGDAQAHGALRVPDAIAVHPLKLALGVLAMARGAGATVHSASPAIGWSKSGHTHVLTTPAGRLSARTIVIATNGYTPEGLHPCLRGTTLPVLSHIIVTRPMSGAEKSASGFTTNHVLTDSRELLYYWRRMPDDRILFGGRGRVTETPQGQLAQRDYLLAELKAKLPALESISVDYDWWGWVCLTADFLPHIHHAPDDNSVHYAIGYQGSGVSYALYAGKLLASKIAAGVNAATMTATPLPRFALPRLRRVGQRAMYSWYRYCDARG
jgi:taurine dehydrogenase large subunit